MVFMMAYQEKLGLIALYSDFYPVNLACPSMFNFTTEYHPYHINECVFTSFVTNGQGGILYYNLNMVRCLVENSLFFNITSSGNGGLVLFTCSNEGDFIMSKCCSYLCYTSGTFDGQIGHFTTGAVSKIEFYDVSVLIKPTGKYIKGTYYTSNGRILVNSNNISTYCYAFGISQFVNPKRLIYKFSNIESCVSTHTSGGGFHLTSGTGPLQFSNCNLFNNTVAQSYGLITCVTCTLEIHSSVFINNKNILIYGPTYILGCFINHTLTITANAAITVMPNGEMDGVYPYNCINNAMCMISTYNMRLFGTAYCEAESYTSTPHPSNDPVCIPPTPAQSLPASPTECFYQTNQAISLISRVLQLITLLSYSLFTISS